MKRTGKHALCVAAGILMFSVAEFADAGGSGLRDGNLERNPAGGGERVCELFVSGVGGEEIPVTLTVPERKLTEEQLDAALPEIMELLCRRIRGKNGSLREVRHDLELARELPEYGLSVRWESLAPETVSDMGILGGEIPAAGRTVILKVRLANGLCEQTAEIPVTVLPPDVTDAERLAEAIQAAAESDLASAVMKLPEEFEGKRLTYRESSGRGNGILIVLGFVAAAVLYLKEKTDIEKARKKREDSLILDYPGLVSRFLVLTGAGYPVRQVWSRQAEDCRNPAKRGFHPLYEEIETTENQMRTGVPEGRAYAEFGRRLGLRCYVRFAALLESSLNTGGRDLRKLLEAEMDEAFKQRKDVAKKKGEEASAKLLIPMFLMLGTVMVMIVAPAFLSLG